MVALAQALRPDEIEDLKGLQDFYGQEYGGSAVKHPFTGEPRTVEVGTHPVLNPETLDGDSLVKIIEHIDFEIFEIIQSYCAGIYRPGGELSSFNDQAFTFTGDRPLSQEEKKPIWNRYVTYQKYLIQRLSTFKLRIMEAECWFDEQGYLDNTDMSEPMRQSIEESPEALAHHEEFMERYREIQESNSWLPEREKDEAIMKEV